MNRFYCNNCDEDVELKDGKCPKCGTDWNKSLLDAMDAKPINYNNIDGFYDYKERVYSDNDEKKTKTNKKSTIVNEDINNTYDFFIKYSLWIKVYFYIMAVIILVISFVLIDATDGVSLTWLLLSAASAFYGIICEKHFKWKAYMLETNYQIANERKK